MTRSGKEGRETQILFLPLPDRESEDIFPCCCCILNAWSRLCGCRVSEPTRLTVCFDDGVCVAARGVSERGVSEQTEPGERCGRRNELLLLPRQVSPISFWLSLIPALTCCESGCVGLTRSTCTADEDLWGTPGQGNGRSTKRERSWRRGGAEERKKAITC